MTDYLPRFMPGHILSMTTSAPVTAGQLVYVSGNNLVAPTSAACVALGVAAFDDLVGGNMIDVFTIGVHNLAASGAIAAGAAVVPAASGAVATIGSDTTYDQVCGQALAAATSGFVLVKLGIV